MSEFKDVRLEMAVNHGSCKLITYEDWQSQGVVCVDGKMLPTNASALTCALQNLSCPNYYE